MGNGKWEIEKSKRKRVERLAGGFLCAEGYSTPPKVGDHSFLISISYFLNHGGSMTDGLLDF